MWGYGGYGGWLAEKNANDPYLQVTFDNFYEVRGIITQGTDLRKTEFYFCQE